jgi:hypothetical protein
MSMLEMPGGGREGGKERKEMNQSKIVPQIGRGKSSNKQKHDDNNKPASPPL